MSRYTAVLATPRDLGDRHLPISLDIDTAVSPPPRLPSPLRRLGGGEVAVRVGLV